jgi:hypothetical protein
LSEIARDGDYDYVNFISGQDYPVWPTAKIVRFLEGADGRQFLHGTSLDENGWTKAAERVQYFHYFRESRALQVAFAAVRGLMRALSLKRKMVEGLVAYGGSSWFILSSDCVRYILKYVDSHPSYVAFMKTVECVDEVFFHTIVLNSEFRGRVVNDNHRYIDWSECKRGLSSNAKWLSEQDFDNIVATGAMFCRKLEPRTGAKLMELLDAHRAAQ